ncbi:hypothetical protein QJS66_07425 [Kocuria rhizophila]|nr:hypothetical protein QJS66_07425 [Kocuria rhizophila]
MPGPPVKPAHPAPAQPLEQLLHYAPPALGGRPARRCGERPDGSTATCTPLLDVGAGAAPRGVGFADLAPYTSLSRQMNERTLANLASALRSAARR